MACHHCVAGLGAIDMLVSMAAQAPTPGMALACGAVLHNLAKAPALRPTLCCSPSLAKFLALAWDADSDIGNMAVSVLCNLAGVHDIIKSFIGEYFIHMWSQLISTL